MWEVLVGQTLIEWNFIGAHKIRCDLFKSHLILGLSLVHKWPPTVKVLGLARIHIPHAPKLPTSLVISLTDSHSSLIPLSLSHSLDRPSLSVSHSLPCSPSSLTVSPNLSPISPLRKPSPSLLSPLRTPSISLSLSFSRPSLPYNPSSLPPPPSTPLSRPTSSLTVTPSLSI